MSELVAMKGTKSGIVIVLNEEAAFEELKHPVFAAPNISKSGQYRASS